MNIKELDNLKIMSVIKHFFHFISVTNTFVYPIVNQIQQKFTGLVLYLYGQPLDKLITKSTQYIYFLRYSGGRQTHWQTDKETNRQTEVKT